MCQGYPLSHPWDLCGSAYKGTNLSWGHFHLMLPPGPMIPLPQGLS